MKHIWILIVLLVLGCSKSSEQSMPALPELEADRVFMGGQIYTVDSDRSWAEAVAIRSGRVIANFDEALNSTEATDPANFAIAGLSVNAAELLTGDRSVRLTTSTMTSGASYTLVVNNIKDLAGNTMQPDSSANFDFFETMTASFQDGLAPDPGYDGTSDAYIREASASTAHGLETTLQVDGDEASGTGQDMSSLVSWDISSIPAGSTVESARMILGVTNISNGSYSCYPMLTPWTESEVTWNQASSGTPWGAPGASSASDSGANAVCTVIAGSTGSLTVDLNPDGIALVQSWVNDSASNYGIIISDTATTDGADFHSSESTTNNARPRFEVTYRVSTPPVNTAPTADFSFDCSNLDCTFTETSSDGDGNVTTWSWDFGDSNTSSTQNPAHSYAAAGDFTVTLTVTDDDGATDDVSMVVTVSEPPSQLDRFAEADLPSAGSVSGTFNATHGDDSAFQSITERESGGKKNNRYSYLSHTWRFTVAPGSLITVYANAWSGGSSEGDQFRFEWSSDNSSFNHLFTVSTTSQSNVQSAVIPASGTVYIRVQDTDD
ncbi:DNRLRE domain-containing protein, partial [Pseudomonadota bacterium]